MDYFVELRDALVSSGRPYDLELIEKETNAELQKKLIFTRKEVSADEAKALFQSKATLFSSEMIS